MTEQEIRKKQFRDAVDRMKEADVRKRDEPVDGKLYVEQVATKERVTLGTLMNQWPKRKG